MNIEEIDKKVIESVNEYFRERLPEIINRDRLNVDEVNKYRENFLEKFGPDKLEKMSDDALLVSLSFNVNENEPMDYWLEFKNDDEFKGGYFGGIKGGSAAKYGVWQDKNTEEWRTAQPGKKTNHNVSQDEALSILKDRRDEIVATVNLIRERYEKLTAEDIDPKKFHNEIMTIAKKYYLSVWFHKYLHLVFPRLITWNAALEHSRSSLYRLGIVPSDNVYENDINHIKFWNKIDALKGLPEEFRYRCGSGLFPRDHWLLEVDQKSANDMVANGLLSFGPNQVEDVRTALRDQPTNNDKKSVVDAAFKDAGLSSSSIECVNLKTLLLRVVSGSIVTLAVDNGQNIIIGEVKKGASPSFNKDHERPHTVAVNWYDVGDVGNFFDTRVFNSSEKLKKIPSTNPLLAAIEAGLIVSGLSPWNIESFPRKKTLIVSELKNSVIPLAEPEGITGQVFKMLERKKQVILYGPPGTGKTYHALRIAKEFIARKNHNILSSSIATEKSEEIHYGPYLKICTFHPSYSYEDFVEGVRINCDENDKRDFKKEDGIFKEIADQARGKRDKTFVLIIDEINRGNIPKIFGELITLIESTKRDKSSVKLPLSKKEFTVPSNLYIIGAMNTADRSILLLDTALRRRFAFKELMPDSDLLKNNSELFPLKDWLTSLNKRIVKNLGRDGRNLQIGHSYLMNQDGMPLREIEDIGNVFRDDIWPLIQEYCYENPNILLEILGEDLFDKESNDLKFKLFKPDNETKLKEALETIIDRDDDQDKDESDRRTEGEEPDEN